jgi:hypothetical protein
MRFVACGHSDSVSPPLWRESLPAGSLPAIPRLIFKFNLNRLPMRFAAGDHSDSFIVNRLSVCFVADTHSRSELESASRMPKGAGRFPCFKPCRLLKF